MLPKTPRITKGELQALRINKESISKIKTYEDVAKAFRELRNAIGNGKLKCT